MKRQHDMPFGAQLNTDGTTLFRLWAPTVKRVAVVCNNAGAQWQADMQPLAEGWYGLTTHDAPAGALYRYRIDDNIEVADPASRFNPHGVHDRSEVIDSLAFEWQDEAWCGRPWHEAVIYELHVGTFTRAGTFAAMHSRLKALAAIGITAIELMPVAAFSGKYGWGYDGVLPYAPHAPYGRPESLKALVQAAHQCGLMVLLDVVYNHFGPDGNYLNCYAKPFFTDRVHTPWGSAIEFEGAAGRVVRDYFIHNALYWIEEYHLDGLRIDAVHAMHDRSATHFIDELAQAVQRGPGRERPVHVVLENHENQTRHLRRSTTGQVEQSTAQWNDDFHHALHVLLTGERDGYYIDFAAQPINQLGRALAEGFVFQGESSEFAHGKPRGEPSRELPPTAFVNFLQTHDQVGNRAFGERLSQLSQPDALHAALAILLLAPQPPMLFMGEEFAADQPFLYFCDFHGELGRAVTAGRRREFAGFAAFADPAAQARIPDPCARGTLTASRLAWSTREKSPHREVQRRVRRLLRLRARELMPLIPRLAPSSAEYRVINTHELIVSWPVLDDGTWVLHANLSDTTVNSNVSREGKLIYSTAIDSRLHSEAMSPWEVRWLRMRKLR
jgi:maltooligosyltrehalose trehalohydrolase